MCIIILQLTVSRWERAVPSPPQLVTMLYVARAEERQADWFEAMGRRGVLCLLALALGRSSSCSKPSAGGLISKRNARQYSAGRPYVDRSRPLWTGFSFAVFKI